jgi:hypothetical protein
VYSYTLNQRRLTSVEEEAKEEEVEEEVNVYRCSMSKQ